MKKTTATLFAPPAYWSMPQRLQRYMGCGPGVIGDLFVPDTIWGLNVQPACAIHDYMYAVGECEPDRELADRVLLNNLVRLINAATTYKLLMRLRLRRARCYYAFVRAFGGPAFWSGKNLPGEERAYVGRNGGWTITAKEDFRDESVEN